MMEMNLPPSSDNYDDGAFITFYNQSPSTLYLPAGGDGGDDDDLLGWSSSFLRLALVTANYDHDGDCVCGSSKSFT